MHAFWRPDTLARCGLAGLLVAALSAGCQPADDAREPDERTHLLIVVDGLRPDLVTAELTPVLHDLGQRGVVFTNHHAVFPTVTRVNAASISTGAYPAAHGLMGNTVYVPAVDAGSGVSTGSKSVLDAIALASDGRLLTATTLGEVLAEAGRSLVVLSSGTQGSGMLLNPTVAGGAVIHPDYTLPEELDAELADALGRRLAPEAEVADRTRWIVDVYLRYVVTELRPDVTILWMGDLDGASHASGVGSPEALAALEAVDGEIARIMATLDDVNLLVASDHGFSTLTGEMELDALLAPYTGTLADGLPDVVRAEGAIYVRDGSNGDDEDDAKDEKVARIVSALQRAPGYGAIFTRPSAPGAPEGIVPGTLSRALVHWDHARAADILVSADWTPDVNEHGYAGTTSQRGTAGHGSTSPFDIHATLIAVGPDFREGAVSDVPTANVDLAPTLLRLLGLETPDTMQGRAIEEALRGGSSAGVPVEFTMHTSESAADGASYVVSAGVSTVDGHRYLDEADGCRP
ncbi:MAG: alkaline phosphatase family protein [Vicinamibacterales bacterium]|jgi:predicted AlkP superfamily pyrophosphatase or phosphodiesterase|nr:alkaline phosphatase family protein [Vicinamibacterales bacterium]MDP7470840.1 alkaline phosphatase family protein [Vicinamibacterales bacterium]MDP7672279.1 alkaline phosphatase family protein [Vicinamibacterales bacterium]HJO37475.1 alkaline phosphatase family protein [Vicinamibacterales bacterium]|tara:strand:- start:1083 stop:2639 length:1557 start_codon:yes stop_codon:yes gene_type:complete